MRIQKWFINGIGTMVLAVTFLFINPAEAVMGEINLIMKGTGFYVSARCYGGGKSVGQWRTNISWNGTHHCGPPGDKRHAEYIRINRKNLWFRNQGSTWRPRRPSTCFKNFCVYVSGSSIGSASYRTACKRHC